MLYVSPAEPAKLKTLGDVSSVPERHGVDFLMLTDVGSVGVQRKTVPDLIASLHDGRLKKEIRQVGELHHAVLVVEGDIKFTGSGEYVGAQSITRAQIFGVFLTMQLRGWWIMRTSDMSETADFLVLLERWLAKEKHNNLAVRPRVKGEWGTPTNREWSCWFLQGFDGIGPEMAAAIYDEFNGIPLTWTCTQDDLTKIKGIGKTTAARLLNAVGCEGGASES